MSEEEKRAIEIIKEKLFHYNLNKKMGLLDKMTEQGRKECEAMETILDLVESYRLQIIGMKHEIKEKNRQLNLKNKYLEAISFVGSDYDGMNTTGGLKSVIDDLVGFADKGIKNDDEYAVYQGGNGKYFNILYEEVKNEEEN